MMVSSFQGVVEVQNLSKIRSFVITENLHALEALKFISTPGGDEMYAKRVRQIELHQVIR